MRLRPQHHLPIIPRLAAPCVVAASFLLWLSGCSTPPSHPITPAETTPYRSVALREGDVVKITFPGAPSLSTVQQVMRDGTVALDEGSVVTAQGRTPDELEADILKLYEDRLVTKQVLVTVESSVYPVYITGAVLRPGKIMVTHAMTVVEAIAEAGGLDESRAKAKAVVVTREEGGVVKNYRLNVRAMLEGSSDIRFYLHPMDTIYVPTKIQLW